METAERQRRKAAQAEERRRQKKRVAVQQMMWLIFAILFAAGCVFAFFKMQDKWNSPPVASRRYVETPKLRKKLRATSFQEEGKLVSFFDPRVTGNFVRQSLDQSGTAKAYTDGKTEWDKVPKGETAVDVMTTVEGEKVVGSDAPRTGKATHRVVQQWQKLRADKLNAKGKWALVWQGVYKLGQDGNPASVETGN